ncbi:MAG: YfiR family protein [Acidobacteriota bacterium]|nr:YfiR family protein [Acidobacteriota bacterium]
MRKFAFFFFFALALCAAPVHAEKAPANLQAALIIKLLPFYNNLGSKEFTIHVVGAPEVANLLKGKIGSMTGKAKLVNVVSSDSLPGEKVDVLYLGTQIAAGTAFAKENGCLSITGDPAQMPKGITLGIGLENSKPKVYLNLKSSKAEGVDWNPAILKVAKTV